MRIIRIIVLGAAVLGAAACQTRQDARNRTQTAAGEVQMLPDVGNATLTRADLAHFAPLPARMDLPGKPPSEALIDLGRMLFYEPVLSDAHDISCNSCHGLNAYGADGRKVSFGHKGQEGSHNAPTVYNAAGQIAQFWDGRAPTVEEQAKGPILNPAEMGMPNPQAVLDHMKSSAKYRAAFAAAFPGESNPITYDNVGRAIGAFERGLVTPSRWDRFLKGDTAVLNAQEKRGAKTFVAAGCTNCHTGAAVGGQMFQKVGLVHPWPLKPDSGRYLVTKNPADLYVLKVPPLRDVEKTAPYFSFGEVASLDSAIMMMGRYQLGRALSETQVQDIHAWLRTLTGEIPLAYIAEPRLPANQK
jgi:cytochrome c peroxidase